ncbi:MAG: hypothetical protein QXQ53_04970 [Candidatus Methanosuratincola sp.]
MPFTPFHLGPAILAGILLLRHLNLPALIVASAVLDLEPLLVIVTDANYPLHGFFHTFLGGTLVALALSFVMCRFSGCTARIVRAFGISQTPSPRTVAAASFLGVYSHLLLDSPLYADMEPFFPIALNPLFSPQLSGVIYASCAVAFFLGVAAYAARLLLPKQLQSRAGG